MNRTFNSTKKPTDNVIAIKKNPIKHDWLDILDHEVQPNAIKQTIVWKLDRALERGNFVSFTWRSPPPPAGIFGNPEISPDGNSLTLRDLNNDPANSPGEFGYFITVELDGITYTSEETISTNGVMRDPIIINR